jgi:hypothetical protein
MMRWCEADPSTPSYQRVYRSGKVCSTIANSQESARSQAKHKEQERKPYTMSGKSKASRSGNQLVRCILAVNEEHGTAHWLGSEPESLIVILEKSAEYFPEYSYTQTHR